MVLLPGTSEVASQTSLRNQIPHQGLIETRETDGGRPLELLLHVVHLSDTYLTHTIETEEPRKKLKPSFNETELN